MIAKEAQLDIIRNKAFTNELEKLAVGVGMIGKFVLKTAPKLLKKLVKPGTLNKLKASEGVTGRSYKALSEMAHSSKKYNVSDIYDKGIKRMSDRYGGSDFVDFGKSTLGKMERTYKGVNPDAPKYRRWAQLPFKGKKATSMGNREGAGAFSKA